MTRDPSLPTFIRRTVTRPLLGNGSSLLKRYLVFKPTEGPLVVAEDPLDKILFTKHFMCPRSLGPLTSRKGVGSPWNSVRDINPQTDRGSGSPPSLKCHLSGEPVDPS